MPQIVVTTVGGEPIRSLLVQDTDLERQVGALLEALPDLPLYIDDQLVTPELRASLLHQAAKRRESTRIEGEMTPEEFREANEALVRGYEDLRRVQFNSARELAQLVQTHNQAALEDGIKTRFMLHQCLEDIHADELGAPVRARTNIPRPDAGTETPVIEGNAWTRANQRWQARADGYRKK